ncbi:hypothetical protein Cni_G05090 [Canna indica]|uniref:Uncharacterized protein n=1 Tax=Canna indica TaxID=4628 RepID=A0AAQ3Q3E6_9LILI|nr:hypothetical protein Cni_G05090 [Canna indica]
MIPPCDHEKDNFSPRSISLSSQPSSLLSLPSFGDSHAQTQSLHHCIATVRAHTPYVSTLLVAGNGSIYSGGPDQEIRLWPLQSLPSDAAPTSFTVAVSKSPVKSVAVSADNLFSSHQDGKIRVWQISRRGRHCYKLRAVLPTAVDRFMSLLAPKNYVEVRRHRKCTWVHHVDAVSGLALSHDGAHLYSVSWDRALKVWRAADFKCVESVAGAHQDAINAVAVSPDGHVYTGSADARINVWRWKSEEGKHSLVQTLERHRSAVNALALSADGAVLYSGACDRAVVVWEGGGGRMAAAGALRGHKKAILCLAAAAAEEVVCSGSADSTVRVWRRQGGGRGWYACLAVLEGHRGPVKSLAAAMEEETGSSWCMVVSGGMDCNIKVWRIPIPPPPLME